MTPHSCAVDRTGTLAPGDALTCDRTVEAASRSRKSARRLLPGILRRSVMAHNARGNVCFWADSQGRQGFNFAQRVWLDPLYPSVPMAVTPAMSIELETLATNMLTLLTCQRDYRAAMGVTSKRAGRLASRFCADCLLTAQSQARVRQRSTPGKTRTLPSPLNSSRVRREARLATHTDLVVET